LIRRRAEEAFRWRGGRVVDPEAPGTALVEVVPRSHWGRLTLNAAADVGFLRVEPGGGPAWFEGDFERYYIPAEAVISCELEVMPTASGMPEESDDPIRLVVVRARQGGTVWEAPFYVRHDGTPDSGKKTRGQLADDLLRRLRGVALSPGEAIGAVASGTPASGRPTAGSRAAMTAWLAVKLVVGFVGVFLGPLLTHGGFHDIRVARLSSAKPRILRVEDLGDVWPEGNPNVTLTDFEPLLDGLLRQSVDPGGPWNTVHIPLIPTRDRGRPSPGEAVRVVVRSVHVRNEDDLRRLLAAGKVTGLLADRGNFFGPLREGLVRFNPGIHPSRCWTLKEGIEPMHLSTALLAATAGVLLFAVGSCVAIRSLMSPTQPPKGWFDRGLTALGRVLRRCQESRSPVAILSLVVTGSILLGVFASHVADGYFTDPRVTFPGEFKLAAATDLGAALVVLALSLLICGRSDTASSIDS
jgi:hypothetical protein